MPATLERRLRKLQSILEVAKAMTAERHLDALLGLVIDAAARVAEADRCTLFLVDAARGVLVSRVAHGTDVLRIPLGSGIAGDVALRGVAARIDDAAADPRFHADVDRSTGYRTRTILAVPMRNTRGEVVGVLQALNRAGGAFTDEDEELLGALAGPAASAIENAVLNEEIERLFEGFVQASVLAIEQRDPTTAGHSGRVATFTVGLARAVERRPPPGLPGIRFGDDAIRQLRYAALLHDFGKVGVRERVLVKADKLHPHELERVRARFDLVRAGLENRRLRARLEGRSDAAAAEEERELEAFWETILLANRPAVLPEAAPARLREGARRTFRDPRGEELPWLTEEEVAILSIPKGSLTDAERREIEGHVAHTFRFLSQIPWTRALGRVPEIAHGHHERLDGGGYPRRLAGGGIAVEARMMAIADVYDALTASDRPYKKAVPSARALDILADEARRGGLDPALLEVFVEAGVWRLPGGA